MKNGITESEKGIHPVDAVMKSMYLKEAMSIGIDIVESEIDSLSESEILKNIPIVKTVHSIAKISLAIRDRHFLKKVLIFIASFNQGTANSEEIERRRKAAESNEKWLRREVELITIHLDRLDETEKSKITAAFYTEYINQNISWEDFREYLSVIERVFLQDFEQVLKLYEAYIQEKKVSEQAQKGINGVITKFTTELNCDRLIAVGLVSAKRTAVLSDKVRTEYSLTGLGLKLAEVLQQM